MKSEYMTKILCLALAIGLASCENGSDVKVELDSTKTRIDSLVKRIENSPVVDSIKSQGGKLLDSVKSKGGRLIKKADERMKESEKPDSIK